MKRALVVGVVLFGVWGGFGTHLFIINQAHAAVSFVQGTSTDGYSVSSVALTLKGSTINAGDVIAADVLVGKQGSSLTSVTATCVTGNFTLVNNSTTFTTKSYAAMAYGIVSNTSSTCKVTATLSAVATSATVGLAAHDLRGVAASSPLDGNAMLAQSDPGTGANALTSGNITTTQSGDYIFGVTNNASNNSFAPTAGTGFTARQYDASSMQTEDEIQSAPGSTAATFTSSAGSYAGFITGIMAFKASNTATTPTISSFSASPTIVASGGASTLSWNISNASSVAITPGSFSTSTLVGSLIVNPTSTTTYTITATNANGTSTATATVTVDASTPTTPTGLTATPISSSVIKLTWASSTDSGGSGIAGYDIFSCIGSSCTPSTLIATSSGASYSNTGLTAGTTYTYAVSAYNGVGTVSATSTTASGTTTTGALPTISSFSASPTIVASGGASTLSWNISNASSVAITPGSFSTSTLAGSLTVNPTSTTTYTITATNANGTSTATAMVSVPTAPTAPGSFSVSNPTTSTLSLSWTASTPNNGATISFYRIYRGLSTSNMSAIATTTNLAFTDTNLATSTTYFYSVTAQDSVGNVSASSSVASSATQSGIPSAWSTLPVDMIVPLNTSTPGTTLTAAIANAGTVCTTGSTCTWGTPPTSSFTVGADQASFTNLGAVAVNGGSTFAPNTLNYNNFAFNDDIAGPGNNEEVVAGGNAAKATAVSDVVGILTPPKQAQSGSDMDMVILWANNGDYAVTQFNPSCSGAYGVRIEVKPTAHSGCIAVLPQTDYYFAMSYNFTSGLATLYVYNTNGSLFGSTSVVSGDKGGTFEDLTFGNNEGGFEVGTSYFQNMMLNWTNASSGPLFWTQTGTSTPTSPSISSFSASPTIVAPAGASTLSWNTANASSVAITPGNFSTSTLIGSTIVNPTSTTTYTITATNPNGTATSTATVNVATAPTAPGNLSAGSPTTSTIPLSWTTSTPNNGATISFYTIYRGVSTSSLSAIATTTGLAYTNTNLATSTTYYYDVTAQDSVGNVSAPSSIVSATTQNGVLPTISSFSASPATIALNGTSVLNWNTANATSLSISPSIGTVTGTSTTTGALSTSTTYTLTATNAFGTATATTMVTVVTPPTAPSSLSVSNPSTSTLALSWTSSTPNNGATISFYTIYRGLSTSTMSQVATTSVSAYADSGLATSTTYYYDVTATDNLGNTSPASSIASGVTQDGILPTISSFSASPVIVALNGTSILNWNAANADSLSISPAIGTVTGTSTATGALLSSTTYTLTATNAFGTATATTTVTVDITPPSVPTNLTATAVSQTEIDLSWFSSTDPVGVAGYDVYQNGVNIATTSIPAYASTGLSPNTAYTYTVDAYDTLGNVSAESASSTARTQGGELFSAPPAGIAVDANVSADSVAATTQIMSPVFSTASANETLLAFVSGGGSTPWATVTSVTGGGLTWNLVGRADGQGGTSEIWQATASSALASTSVTANLSANIPASITVMSFTGTSASAPIGSVSGSSASNGAPASGFLTTESGSWVLGVGNDANGTTAPTPGQNQTTIHQFAGSPNGTFWVQQQNNSSTAGGVPVTINDTTPTGDGWNLVAVELLP